MSISKEDQTFSKVQNRKVKVDKYLTDMKELPPSLRDPSAKEDESSPKVVPPEAHLPAKEKVPEVQNKGKAAEGKVSQPVKLTDKENKADSTETFDFEKSAGRIYTFKDVTLGVINLISIILIVVLLIKLPQKATEFQAQKVEQLQNQVSPQTQFGNISADKEKAGKLDALFLDEAGVIRFVGDVESLKTSFGAISKVTFASQKAVKDESGMLGIPVTIELKGKWADIAPALERIETLPYLIRPISIEAGPSKDDPTMTTLDYGVFLYTNDKTYSN